MTLSEYLNQPDPKRHPSVILQEDEYKLGSPYKVGIITHTPIWIIDKQFVEQVGMTEYVLVGGSLYAIDSDGNSKNRSVFRIAEDIPSTHPIK